jgi:hypothetical protein
MPFIFRSDCACGNGGVNKKKPNAFGLASFCKSSQSTPDLTLRLPFLNILASIGFILFQQHIDIDSPVSNKTFQTIISNVSIYF